MDPATIYAITVTLAGIGSIPKITIERLPPQWTMADCIKDHEEKLAGKPNTMARCVSRDRPYYGPDTTDDDVVYTLGIIFGKKDADPTMKVTEPTPQVPLETCQREFADHFASRRGVRAYCFKSRIPPKTCNTLKGLCSTLPS